MDSEDSLERHLEVVKTPGGPWWVLLGFMPGRGTASAIFYQQAVTGDTFSEKEGFVLYIFRFGESFWFST